MATPDPREDKVVIAAATGAPGDVPTVILGMSQAAWDFMEVGGDRFHHFDLRVAGIPAKVLIIAGETRASVIEKLNDVAKQLTGKGLENMAAASRSIGIETPDVDKSKLN